MTRRQLAMIAFVIALGALGVWVGGSRERDPAGDVAALRGTGGPRADGSTAAGPPPEPPRTVVTKPYAPPADEVPVAVPPGGPNLAVVDAGSGERIAGAVVHVLDLSGLPPAEVAAALTLASDPAEILEARGLRLVANEGGVVRLPPFQSAVLVSGTAPGLFGLASLPDPDALPLELALRPDRDLEIAVVDDGGAPLPAIPVELRALGKPGDGPLWTGFTGAPDGVARVRHAQWVRDPDGRGAIDVVIGFPSLVAADVEVPLPHDAWPEQRITIVLPGSGRVLVDVSLGQGAAPPPGTYVSLERPRTPNSRGARQGGAALRSLVVDGTATFPAVGVGQDLVATAACFDQERRPASTRLRSPETSGEEVRVKLVLSEASPVLVGRVRDQDGVPLVRRRLGARVLGNPGAALALGSTITDDDGRFRLPLRLEPAPAFPLVGEGPPERGRLVLVAATAPRGLPDPNGPAASVDLPPSIVAGEIPLGDIDLRWPPLFASGQFVDGGGRPIAGVPLAVERKVERHFQDRWPRWQRVTEFAATTKRDGSFTFRGSCDGTEFRIAAEIDGWFEAERTVFVPGTSGLRVTLSRAGILEGRVLLPMGLPPQRVHVSVLGDALGFARPRPMATPGRKIEATMALDRDGRFRFARLRPGRVAVAVKIGWSGEPLRTVEDLPVVAGETRTDDRLVIDLRDTLRAITLTIVDPDGRPVGGAEVELARADARGPGESNLSDEAGRVLLIATEPAIDATIRAAGYRDTRVAGIVADRRVVLGEAIPVRLVFTGEWAIPEPPYSLSVSLVPPEDTPGSGVAPSRGRPPAPEIVRADREVAFDLTTPGTHRMSLSVQERSSGRVRSQTLRGLDSDVIDVIETTAEQVFQVSIPPEILRAALEALSR